MEAIAIDILAVQKNERAENEWNPEVGRSRFRDDVWDLTDLTPDWVQDHRRKIDFTAVAEPGLREVWRHYAYWKLGRVKASTVTSMRSNILRLFGYCTVMGADRLSDLDEQDILGLPLWLSSCGIEPATQVHVLQVADEIIRIGQLRGWDVPESVNMAAVKARPEWPKGDPPHKKTKVIPDDTMERVLECALMEEDTINKSLIIILSQTGLRASEVVTIERGCIEQAPAGMHTMEVLISKTVKQGPTPHRILVNSLVVDAVRELEKRNPASEGPLFVRPVRGKVKRMTASDVANRLKSFCLRWSITDADGKPAIHPHMFRTTFVRSLVMQGIPLAFIMEHYAHVSIDMTAHYLQLSREDLRSAWGKAILSPDSTIAGKRAKQIRAAVAKELKARAEESVEDVIASLADSMSFNPLPTGVCLYDLRRGPCSKGESCFFYNCPNYVTEKRFYPVLKRELDLIEEEMSRLKALGREREWQRQYAKRAHLEPLVRDLEEQIDEQ